MPDEKTVYCTACGIWFDRHAGARHVEVHIGRQENCTMVHADGGMVTHSPHPIEIRLHPGASKERTGIDEPAGMWYWPDWA